MVEDALEAVCPGLDPGSVSREASGTGCRVVDGEHVADLVERQLQLAQSGDRPRGLELFPAVTPITGEPIDLGRPKQVELVVMTKGADAQPGKPGELTDRQQVVIHARIVNPSVGRESSGRAAYWVRRCRVRGRSRGG